MVALLQDRLMRLAGTPDGSSLIGADLAAVAHLAAGLIAPVEYASVTGRSGGAYVTVAASDEAAVAVDRAQYDDRAGPCLEALEAEYPAAVPDIAATMTWPGFRAAAAPLGLRTSLSIPLFAGSGATIAALNLYSRDPGPMVGLTSAVWAAYDPEVAGVWSRDSLDPGGWELAAGLLGAHGLRGMIGQAAGLLGAGRPGGDAYLMLRRRAAEAGTSLARAAARIIEQHRPLPAGADGRVSGPGAGD